jgi:hypothetical protein
MTTFTKSLLLASIQLALVLSVAGKFWIDRSTLPRVWARAAPYDPNLPIRGRYVRLMIEVKSAGPESQVTLSVDNGQLIATASDQTTGLYISKAFEDRARLMPPVAFFIAEHVADPSSRKAGEELWAEVSVPKKGPPRPIQLGVKKDGALTPLNLR